MSLLAVFDTTDKIKLALDSIKEYYNSECIWSQSSVFGADYNIKKNNDKK